MRLCFDIDFIIFGAASVSEERYISATHLPTGEVHELRNRTELWGSKKDRRGGLIAMKNGLEGKEFYKAEDFQVVDKQKLRPFKIKGNTTNDRFISPLDGAKRILDHKIQKICQQLGTKKYYGYTGTGDVFRHHLATLQPYKGQREFFLKPLLLKELKAYVCERHNIELVRGIEADDAMSMATVDGYHKWVDGGKKDKDILVAVAVDKDAKQTQGWHFNPDRDSSPRLIEGIGELWLDKKGEVDGNGRMWLYYQMCAGDISDNYSPTCFSNVRYGSKNVYKDLKNVRTDREAFTRMVEIFKRLYPTPLEVETFRGKIRIDWLYVMQEMADMAMMLRKPNDRMVVANVLDKLKINY